MSRVEYNVEQVLARLGIEAKKKGRDWWARCPSPDHEDRNPSWHIRDEPGAERHGKMHCFSCKWGGTVEDLVGAVLGFQGDDSDKREAARKWLAGFAVEQKLPTSVRVKVTGTFHKFRLPEEARFGPLHSWVTPAREFAQSRGIPEWQVDRWGLGYVVDGLLAGRLMIPYCDARGVPRGYTARTFLGKGKVLKRYKEPEPTEGADLDTMFGEQHWESPRLEVYVTEGALNALAVERTMTYQAVGGLVVTGSVAATAGSHLRPAHATKLATFRTVVVLTDPDKAGDRIAADMGANLARHSRVVRVRLPEGKDANDLPREELAARIRGALDAAPAPSTR